MQRHEIWALVMDANTARIVIDVTSPSQSAPDPGEILMETTHQRVQDIMADKPGRSFQSVGSARSSMEYRSDPKREAEHRFATDVVQALTASYRAGLFEKLVVVAGPEMLGILRETLPAELQNCLTAEIPKQLTGIAKQDLRSAITHWLAKPATA